jgi:hypothetical protein
MMGFHVARTAPAHAGRPESRIVQLARGVAKTSPKAALGAFLATGSLAITVYVFLILNDAMMHGGVGYDESAFLWSGWCALKGLVPYVDFLEFRPPFCFLTHALALKLHGFDGFRYRYFFAYFPLSALLAAHASLISRGTDKLLALALMIGFIFLFVNPVYHDAALSDSESIGVSYYLFGVAFLLARTRFRTAFDILGGAFLLACGESKEPFIPCAFATWMACSFTRTSGIGDRSGRRRLLAYFKATALGGLIVVLLLSIYMVPTGAMKQYLLTVKSYFTIFRDTTKSYCVLLGRFKPTTRWNDLVVQWDQARREFLNAPNLSYLFPFAAGTLVFTLRRNPLLFGFVSLAAVFGLYAVTASNCQWIHYYNMTMTGLFLFLAIGLDAISSYLKTGPLLTRMFVRLTVAGLVLLHVWPRFETERAAFGTRKFGTPYVEAVPGILKIVADNTTPADTIFTTGAPNLYIQTNRISAVRESVFVDEIMGFYTGDTDEERFRPIYEQLKKHMPKVVLLDPEHGYRKTRHNNGLFIPFLTAEHYKQLTPYVYLRPY